MVTRVETNDAVQISMYAGEALASICRIVAAIRAVLVAAS
jgi:hypothetical protein